MGAGASVKADGSTALGANTAIAQGATNAVAVGEGASVSAVSGTAIGQASKVSAANSVAIGRGSQATRENTVAVGSAGVERQVTNVAAGTRPTDAVNVAQMQSADQQALATAQSYTDSRVSSLNDQFSGLRSDVDRRLNRQDRRIDKVGAMNAAMSNMAINAANGRTPAGRLAVGAGWSGGQNALSVGYSKQLGERASFSVSGAVSAGQNSAGVGFGMDL